jgi:uncharacterized protein YcbK (DUF882 family)
MKLTEHFSLEEFACHDGTPVPVGLVPLVRVLAERLEVIREALGGKPIKILSGYRSPTWNRKVGGVKNSYHMLGRAADITVDGVTPAQVANTIEKLIQEGKLPPSGLGRYKGFTHYDTRARNARWGLLGGGKKMGDCQQ